MEREAGWGRINLLELSWIQGSRSTLSAKLEKVGSHGLCRPWLPAADRVWNTTSLGAAARPTDSKALKRQGWQGLFSELWSLERFRFTGGRTYILQKHNMDGQKILSFIVFHRIYRQYIHRILVPNYFIGFICIN